MPKYTVFCLHTVNVKTVLFQTIQFYISGQFKCQTVLFNPPGSVAMKGYSAFSQAPVPVEPH